MMGFQSVKQRSVFDLTHEKKLTCTMGQLVPMMCEEVLPGDEFTVQTDMLVRLAPMIAPMMHRVNVFSHFFFVPCRLLFGTTANTANSAALWESFITGGVDNASSQAIPTIRINSVAAGSIADYLGLPLYTDVTGGGPVVNALPFRAYNLIIDEWYRDQNQTAKLGFSEIGHMPPVNRCWEKDYFTSALPWAQRGEPVTLPLGDTADVVFKNPTTENIIRNSDGSIAPGSPTGYLLGSSETDTIGALQNNPLSGEANVYLDNTSNLEVDLSSATAATVANLRLAVQMQRWAETQARGGARYVETLLSQFGVRSPDARLQRPEYLGGGRSPIVVSEVVQTSQSSETSPQGQLAGHGYSAQRTHGFKKTFTEHGYIIGIVSVMPRTSYHQGIPKMFSRATRYDFAWPMLAHVGEQAIKSKELYWSPPESGSPVSTTTPDVDPWPANDSVFGYAPRYEEYRKRFSSCHGEFRASMTFWHLGRIFEDRPTLSSEFVNADPSTRVFAVIDDDNHNVWLQLLHQVKAVRPLPQTGTPGLMDH